MKNTLFLLCFVAFMLFSAGANIPPVREGTDNVDLYFFLGIMLFGAMALVLGYYHHEPILIAFAGMFFFICAILVYLNIITVTTSVPAYTYTNTSSCITDFVTNVSNCNMTNITVPAVNVHTLVFGNQTVLRYATATFFVLLLLFCSGTAIIKFTQGFES